MQPGVDLEVHARGRTGRARDGGDILEEGRVADAEVESAASAPPISLASRR